MQCDVTDLQGNHCPEEAVHTVVFDGVETHLCERCYENVLAGAYGSHLTQRAPDASPDTCEHGFMRGNCYVEVCEFSKYGERR